MDNHRDAENQKYRSHVERRGNKATQRIASAVARKSWHWTMLNLAWTVGPVTFIALQIGHYLGFGKQAPIENFIYFAGYTFIAAGLAGFASIAYDAFYKPKIDKEKQQLLNAIDYLHEGMVMCRDLTLQQLEPEQRRIMAAYYILQSVGTTPSAIETAVMDLTDSATLTSAARRAQVFAEQGMQSRIDDIWHDIKQEVEALTELKAQAPLTYHLLTRRLKGISPSIKAGIERREGFIERILQASEANDDNLMTLHDALDMFTLAFELINDRHIAVLDARLKGDDAFEHAQQSLDEARHHYRMTLRRRNSRIRLMAEQLYMETDIDVVVEASDKTAQLLTVIEKAAPQLDDERRQHYHAQYDKIIRLNKQLTHRRERLLKEEARYSKRWQAQGSKLTLAMQKNDLRQAGFYIIERSISLNDKQKLTLSQIVSDAFADDTAIHSNASLKQTAMEIADALDSMIDMSQPEEQLAIESSHAADFGYVTRGLAPATKAGLAATAIDAIHENRRKAAHRLARNLIVFYRVPLTDAIIDLFDTQFGADGEYLRQMNQKLAEDDSRSHAATPSPPIQLPHWNALLQPAKQTRRHA